MRFSTSFHESPQLAWSADNMVLLLNSVFSIYTSPSGRLMSAFTVQKHPTCSMPHICARNTSTENPCINPQTQRLYACFSDFSRRSLQHCEQILLISHKPSRGGTNVAFFAPRRMSCYRPYCLFVFHNQMVVRLWRCRTTSRVYPYTPSSPI
jgi:hypothetical protein